MEKLNELRMTLIILLFGVFFISGCFFDKKYEVTLKTNGGTKMDALVIKSGDTIEDIKEPKKDGYKFIGWYYDGKKFDFKTKIEEDITLVAKWEKVEVDLEDNDDEELKSDKEDKKTTTTTKVTEDDTTKKTTKKKTSSKKTTKKTSTTRKNTTTTSTTTTTTTTTTTSKIVTTTQEPITVETTTTTQEVTSDVINVSTIPTSQLITTSQVVTTEVVKMNISIVEEVREEVNPDTLEDELVRYENIKISFDVLEENSNVSSNISVEDYEELINSDKKLWKVYSNKGLVYSNMFDESVEDIRELNLIGNKERVNSITISNGLKNFVIDYDTVLDEWFIKYPSVTLGVGLDVMYYSYINDALYLANKGDTITLLSDITLSDTLVIDKVVNIDFNNKGVNGDIDYLLEYKDIDDELSEVFIKNLDVCVKNFIKVNDSVKLSRVLIEDSKITYSELFKSDDTKLPIVLVNTSISGIL